MRILTMTTLYPNAATPAHGVFVENRLAAYRDRHGGEFRVIAPAPWFPVSASWAGRYGAYARIPKEEVRRGVRVIHPRYAIPPKIGMTYAAAALERCFLKAAREQLAEGFDFDLIDAHYLYPDGVAATRVARRLNKPVVLTARGTDVNLLPTYPRQRRMILGAVRDADAVICVAAALRDELIRLGAPAEKISVLRNGVDLDVFRPLDRESVRQSLGLQGDVIASVGHLTERKGHHIVIDAVAEMPDATLLIAGAGEERAALERRAAERSIADRVRFLGAIAHEKLVEIYNAADALALASSREGWPNVLLEAMACGTPAVASPVWGSGEVIREKAAGRLAAARTAPALKEAIGGVLAERPQRADTRRYAEQFSWDETSDGLKAVFESAVRKHESARRVTFTPLHVRPGRPRLIITADTEESFDWEAFSPERHRVCPPEDLDRFQKLAEAFGAAPIYFLTYPVIADGPSAAYFRELMRASRADLGLHLHQWVTPPLGGFDGAYYSFQCNLPPATHRLKLNALAERFESAFGRRARAHRAGRYGIDRRCYLDLAEAGVSMDFSPSVGFDFSAQGGPDFSTAANQPQLADADGRRIAVTPVCGGLALRGARLFLKRSPRDPGSVLGRRGGSAFLTAPARLTCENLQIDDVKALTRRLVADETPVLTFSFHSTTFTPGGNPYTETRADVERHLEFCNRYFDFFKTELGGEILSLSALEALYVSSGLTSA
jgi:glycosyltransferase involved in cell wall biosynthesis